MLSIIMSALQNFWIQQDCILLQPYNLPIGAGTYHPASLFFPRAKPYNVFFYQSSVRPKDGRSGQSHNRLYTHLQCQVLMKPIPENIKQLVLESLKLFGITQETHNIQFIANNWNSTTIGAYGLGWELICNGLEILQYTYFQQLGGKPLEQPIVELTYGIERLAMIAQNVQSIYDLKWSEHANYADIRLQDEIQFSQAIKFMNADDLKQEYSLAHSRFKTLSAQSLYLAAYHECMKMAHAFNLMDAAGMQYSDRAQYIQDIRHCVGACMKLYDEAEAK